MIALARLGLSAMVATVGRWGVVRLTLLQLVAAVTEGLGLLLLVPVVQSLGGAADLHLPGMGLGLSVAQAFGLVLAVVCVRALAQWRAAVLAVDIRLRTVDRLRLGLLDDLYVAEWAFLAGQRRSHVVQRLTTEVERAHQALTMLVRVVVGGLLLVVTIAAAVVLAPVIGGLAALALLVVAVVAGPSTRGATMLGRRMTDRMADLGATLSDSLASARVMRAHDASATWSRLVAEDAARVRAIRRAFVSSTTALISGLGVVAVVAVLALILLGRGVGMSTAELASLAVIATRLLASAQTLLTASQAFVNDAPALERLRDFGEQARAHPESPAPAVASPVAADPDSPLVELRSVSVRYAADAPPALSGVELAVPRRGLVALTGPSGSGKSTLLDVLLGLLPVEHGVVLVEGAALVDLTAWRARLGYVPQQTVLVPGTVWQNLTWSLQPGRTVTEEEAWAALETARAAEVVHALPGRLHAPLDEVAALSGGEQQRLAIARALVRRPELLVLDEATSGLDAALEEQVVARLVDEHCASGAIVMVTHRAAPLAHAMTVVCLDRGRVVLPGPVP